MSISVTWRGGDGVNVIQSTYYIGFFGAHFGTSIPIGSYQDTTYITDASGSLNYGVLPNVKFISDTNANWGDGSEAITNILDEECTIKLSVASGSGFNLQALQLIAWNGGVDDSIGPANMVVKAFESGNGTWTLLSGSASPLTLTPHIEAVPSSSYDYYISLSATPSAVGTLNTVALKLYAEYY